VWNLGEFSYLSMVQCRMRDLLPCPVHIGVQVCTCCNEFNALKCMRGSMLYGLVKIEPSNLSTIPQPCLKNK